jgi:23S rRNA (cytidine1920-2'-O)/16S rRNA (cytidine1409-2'-O)-methyltransferase
LQRGAARVHAVDAGTNQMDWRLRNDTRVHLLENTNARYLEFALIGETVDLLCVDVSFISVKLILPRLMQFCREGTQLILLIKPQFEAGREQVGKGGIVWQSVEEAGFSELECVPCPILGAEGNQEYLLHGRFRAKDDPGGRSGAE